MTKLTSIILGSALGLTLAASVGLGITVGSNANFNEAQAASTTFSWTANGSTTSGYSFVCTNGSDKTDYYQDKNSTTGLDIYLKKSSGVLWSDAPVSTSLTVKVGGGSKKDPLTNNVTAYFVGSDYSTMISSSETTVTTKVEQKNGKNYTVSLTPVANAYGIMIHHTKESSYNIRIYSISLTYVTNDNIKYSVTYNSNGADSGTVPTDSTQYANNASVTVLGNTGNLAKSNCTFAGWNTATDGSGTEYVVGDTFNISSNTTLYAHWITGRYDFTGDKITFQNQSLTNATKYTGTFTNNSSFEVNFTGGSTPATYYDLGLGMRIYRNNGAINISALNNKTITSVIYTWAGENRPATGTYSFSSGSFSDSEFSVWSGSASAVTLTNIQTETGALVWRLQAIAVQFSDTTISNPVLSGSPECTNYSNAWDITNVKVNANVNGVVQDCTDRFNIVVNTALPTVTETTTMTVSVTATLKTNSSVTVTSNLTANLEFRGETSIEKLYYTPEGVLSGYFYGIFMGYATRTSGNYTYYDYYLANGNYGIYIYGAYSELTSNTTAPTYTPFETYLMVEGGYLSVYNNLYEVSSYVNKTEYPITFTELTDSTEKAKVGTIRTYVVTGEEEGHTFEKAIQMTASRLALVEGTVASLSGTISSSDAVTVTLTLASGNSFPVYIGKNVQSLDYTALASALVVGNKVSVKGFTSIHNTSYQVVNPIDVEVEPTYTAAQFAQDLLNATDAICQAATDTNGPLLAPVWINLEINKWPTLSDTEKATLRNAAANENGTTIEQAMARYDLIVYRYQLTNFINRSISNSANRMSGVLDGNQVVLITAIFGLVIGTTFVAFYALKKRKLD